MTSQMVPRSLRDPLGSEPGGVFFLHGEDEYRKEEVVRLLRDSHLSEDTRDFNLDSLRGSELELEQLASVVATPPMMAAYRVVVVREVEALASSPRARELLVNLASDPPSGLALILSARVPPRSSARFYKDLQRQARSMEFRELGPDDAPGWLMERARVQHDVDLQEEAARGLVAALGFDLGQLAQEVDKLATMVGEGRAITLESVEAGGTRVPRQDRWAWFDLVGRRRFHEALEGLDPLLGHGETGVGLVIGLGTHLLRIGLAVEGGQAALGRALPPNQRWLADRYRTQAGGWTGEEVSRALSGLRDVDHRLKSSPLPDRHHLEWWLLERLAGVAAVA